MVKFLRDRRLPSRKPGRRNGLAITAAGFKIESLRREFTGFGILRSLVLLKKCSLTWRRRCWAAAKRRDSTSAWFTKTRLPPAPRPPTTPTRTADRLIL